MNFRIRRHDEPEINLIPFIDVLLVVLIFLMLTTTYTRMTELKVNLPTAQSDALTPRPQEIVVSVAADGRYTIDGEPLSGRTLDDLTRALGSAARGRPDVTLIVSADALAAHQSVIHVMDAARRVGLSRLSFAAQSGPAAAR